MSVSALIGDAALRCGELAKSASCGSARTVQARLERAKMDQVCGMH